MPKWELVISIVLALLGLGVMAGQGFEFNLWVFLFWGAAVLLALVTWMHREPSGHRAVLSDPSGHEPPSSTLAMLRDMGVRFDKLGPSLDTPRIHREAVGDGRWGTWIAGRFVLDEPMMLGMAAQSPNAIIEWWVPDWVPSGALVSLRYQIDSYRKSVFAIRRRGSQAEPRYMEGIGTVEIALSEDSRFEVVTASEDVIKRFSGDEVAAFTLWLLAWTPSHSKP